MAICYGSGQRRLGYHAQASTHIDVGAGQRAGHNAHNIVGGQGVNIGSIIKNIFANNFGF